MNLLEDFYITIWDKNFNVLGIIDTIETLEMTKYLSKAGTFELTVPVTTDTIKLLKVGNLITKSTNNILESSNYLLEPYIITYKQIKINNKGVEGLEIQGKSLFTWFNQRVLTQNYNITDSISNIVYKLLNTECINPSNRNRIIPNLYLENIDINLNTTFCPQSEYSTLSSALTTLLSQFYIGLEILMSPNDKTYIVKLFQGKNLYLENNENNTPIIFSSNLNNIMGESFTHTNVNFNNVAYVYGTLEGNNTPKLVVIGNNMAIGLNRFEIGICGDDPIINGAELNLTSDNYQHILTAVGEQYLATSEITKNFAGKLNMNADIKYKKNFYVGDKISCINKNWDLNENLVITAVTENWSVQGQQISLTFGYPLPTILEKINKQY